MARSSFYYYLKRLKEPDKYEEVKSVINQIYHENKGRYGYRRITLEMKNRGYIINHKTVLKLMNQLGISAKYERESIVPTKVKLVKFVLTYWIEILMPISLMRNG